MLKSQFKAHFTRTKPSFYFLDPTGFNRALEEGLQHDPTTQFIGLPSTSTGGEVVLFDYFRYAPAAEQNNSGNN